MKHVSWDEYLNVENPWTKRLLGIESFQKHRDIQQVENEYNLDKYRRLLDLDLKSIEEYKAQEFKMYGYKHDGFMTVSVQDELFHAPVSVARALYYSTVRGRMQKYLSPRLCELGCGYGYNLSYLPGESYGGEYSKNAVEIARRVGMNVREFNYYQAADYSFIQPETTVFTVHSIEQLPDAAPLVEGLAKQKSKIRNVVHFEPTLVPERKSLVGTLRNRYIELNDYNRNLISLLQSRSDVEILEIEHDIFGLNPLNSANFIAWRFR